LSLYRSQIRNSQIDALLDKVSKKDYGQYLYSMNLVKLRQFDNQKIQFDFPVTALVAPNGGGKTTVLGSAGLAIKNLRPGTFFTKSGLLDNSMANWSVEYELIDRSTAKTGMIKRTAKFKDLKWTRENFLNRPIIVMGVFRTVPAGERTELKKCASTKFTVNPTQVNNFEQAILDAVEKILGKNVSGFKRISVDNRGRVSLLTGISEKGKEYSEFHFGAGESSIIRLVMQIESAAANSLVLIEEIENGLHPIATIRLVEYLIEAATRKKIQAIFTTHSDYALLPLPGQAIWAALNGNLIQGRLKVSSLRQLHYNNETKLIIYTEDDFTKTWVETMLRYSYIDLESIEIHFIGGDGNAVLANRFNNRNPAKKATSICFIDGDSPQQTSEADKVYRLPGFYPEEYIYDAISDNLSELSAKLCIALGWNIGKQSELNHKVRTIKTTTRDYHLLFAQLGLSLSMMPEETVRNAFLYLWCQNSFDQINLLIDPIKDLLPIFDEVT
jgi:predicted ATPase